MHLRIVAAVVLGIELAPGVELLLVPGGKEEDGHILVICRPAGDGGGVAPAHALGGDIAAEIRVEPRLAAVDGLFAHVFVADEDAADLCQGKENQRPENNARERHPQNLHAQGARSFQFFNQFDSPFPRRCG